MTRERTVAGWFESWGIGSYYLRAYLMWGGGLAATALLGWWCRRWLPRGVRAALVVGLVMAIVRVVAFGNPMALRFFQRQVTPESIGARQWGVMDIDIRKYTRHIRQPELPNLAVGSSQVGAIFSHWVGDPTDPLEVFSLAGMKTLDYELYRDEIAARNPARVILFLSAFDLTAGPELYSWPLAPSHPLRMWDVVTRVRQAGVPEDVVSGPSHAYIASQLFPEYRYRFLFTGLLQQWTRKASTAVARFGVSTALHAAEAATAGAAAITPTAAPSAIDPARIREFLGYYLPQWLDYNVRFLRSFVEYCRTRGIEVVIVEGQVNPVVSGPTLDRLEALVRSRFDELSLLYPNLRVIPARDTHQFTTADYSDLTHVRPDAARRYTARLSALLGRAVVPLAGPCDVTFTAGWHEREAGHGDWLRWSSGAGRLRLRARQSGTYTLHADVLSLVRPNVVDVTIDGQARAAWAITDPAWTFHQMPPVQVTLHEGEASLVQVSSQAPPATQSGDRRALTIAISKLALVAPDGTACAINH